MYIVYKCPKLQMSQLFFEKHPFDILLSIASKLKMSPSLANPIIETLMALNTKQCDEDLDQILANVEEELKSGRYQSGLSSK